MTDQLGPNDLAWVSRPYRWWAFLHKVFRRPDAVAVVKRREQTRGELRRHLGLPGPADPPRRDQGTPEVLVIKLRARKRWAYPKTDERLLGITASKWFKFEVKDVADAYLEVFTGPPLEVEVRRGKARRATGGDGQVVYLVGLIPLESIHHLDWSADPAYWRPRLYVDYGWVGPFKDIVIYEKRDGHLFGWHDVEWKRPRRKYLSEIWWELKHRREIRRDP